MLTWVGPLVLSYAEDATAFLSDWLGDFSEYLARWRELLEDDGLVEHDIFPDWMLDARDEIQMAYWHEPSADHTATYPPVEFYSGPVA